MPRRSCQAVERAELEEWAKQQAADTPPPPRAYPNIYALVAAEGEAFEARPLRGRFRRGAKKDCFGACARRVLNHDDLTYVEGFAARGHIGPIHNAWCIDGEREVIDPTWDFDERTTYLGIPIATSYVARCVLDDDEPLLFRLVRDGLPHDV